LKITDLRIHPIAVADGPLRSSYGLHAPYALRTILELVTDEGIIGLSESYGGDAQTAAFETLRPMLIGRDPFQLTGLWQLMEKQAASDASVAGGRSQLYMVPGENKLDQHARAFAAVEVACLDAVGKAVGRPVCDLYGGRARNAAPFSAYLFYKHAGGGGIGDDAREDEYGECLSPETIVGQAKQMVAQYGFAEIKLKGGVLEPALEIETIRQLRREFGAQVPLRIDPNCAWSVDTSVAVGKALREELSHGGYLEDPCAELDGMSEVRRRLMAEGIDTPFASNVAVTCFAQVVEARDKDAVQIVLSDPHYWGGIGKQKQLSELCQVLNLGLSMHSNNHVGISMMIMAHAACASPHLTHACDTHYPWQTEQDEVIVGGRVRFTNGTVPIEDHPGLGVELDYDQLGRLKERYQKLPWRKRDDELEMQKHVDPTWKRILPRW
jgi:glucarate dehydratase